MDPTTRLLFLRHAEVQEDYHRVFGGRLDIALSARGRRQAAQLADYVARRFQPEALCASPMQRVRETLAPLRELTGLAPVFDDGLREVDFGAWTGLRWEQIGERFGVTAFDWLDQLEQGLIPDAEPPDLFRDRVERALHEILAAQAGRTVAVACHGGVIRMALAILLELPLRKLTHLEVEYASVTWLDHRPGKIELQLHNFTPWRDLL
ncbi:MAG TPA: histidine phosphatase family protein [Verrucomicrobiota bacterium]|nr:histidine phosphatase family protein [Verrucomicrobiota bacterium]